MKDWGPSRNSTLSIFFDVYALGQSISRLLATAMADSPLTPEEYALYSAIFEDEQITPTALEPCAGHAARPRSWTRSRGSRRAATHVGPLTRATDARRS